MTIQAAGRALNGAIEKQVREDALELFQEAYGSPYDERAETDRAALQQLVGQIETEVAASFNHATAKIRESGK